MTKQLVNAIILLVTCVLLQWAAPASQAHEWYPKDCCHNQDCAPILKEDTETVTTIHGTARKDTLILKPERPSKDLGDHACLVPMDDYGQSKAVRCLFRGRGV